MVTEQDEPIGRMLDGYELIIRRFVDGSSSADQFETEFHSYFKNDQRQVVGDEFDVLDGLFASVDDYVAEPELRKAVGGIDADELRTRARSAYSRLYADLS